MVLVLNNDDIASVLTMRHALESLREAYVELGKTEAVNSPRVDLLGIDKSADPDYPDAYVIKTMSGVMRRFASLRFLSERLQWRKTEGGVAKRRKLPHRYSVTRGSILLFDRRSANLVAILSEGYIRNLRVGASAALAAEHLARKDAKVLGILGSGFMAKAHVEALSLVRKLDLVKVYSSSSDSRTKFADEMRAKTGLKIRPVGTPAEAMGDVDIAVLATNSQVPVFGPDFMQGGLHVTNVRHCEILGSTFPKFDRMILNLREGSSAQYYIAGLDPSANRPKSLTQSYDNGYPSRRGTDGIAWDKLPDLADLILGKAPGRQSDVETTCFNNSTGFGVQFTAVGAVAYELALEKGIGKKERMPAFSDIGGDED